MAIDRTPDGGTDANTAYFDAGLRHQVGVRNFTSKEVNDVLDLFEKNDKEFIATLRRQLRNLNNTPLIDLDEKLAFVLSTITENRDAVMKEFRTKFRKNLLNLAQVEVDFEERLINAALPVTVELAQVSAPLLTAIVREQPFSSGTNTARLLDDWLVGLNQSDKRQIREAIQLGLLQGEDVPTIVRRIAGTSDGRFRDGLLSITRRNAEALVRTAINHVSNAARNAFWDANATLIRILRWTSTLDGRTTPICQGRDGKFTPTRGNTLPPGLPALDPLGARPPAHPLCRSVMLAVFDQNGVVNLIGNRPFVRDTRTGRKRQIDFRANTKQKFSKDQWSAFSAEQRNDQIRITKTAWAKQNIGTTPATVTYDEWLRRQSEKFQNEVLGKKRAEKFRSGTKVDRFIDKQGNQLTLKQLAARGI